MNSKEVRKLPEDVTCVMINPAFQQTEELSWFGLEQSKFGGFAFWLFLFWVVALPEVGGSLLWALSASGGGGIWCFSLVPRIGVWVGVTAVSCVLY